MFQIHDRTIADSCIYIISFGRRSHRFKKRLEHLRVAARAKQRRHRATSTCTVCNDLLSISRHYLVIVTEISYSRLEIKNRSRCTTGEGLPYFGVPASRTRNAEYISLLQCTAGRIVRIRFAGSCRHKASDICTEEDRSVLTSTLRHIEIQGLIGRILDICNEIYVFVGVIGNALPIRHSECLFGSYRRVKCQSLSNPGSLGAASCHDTGKRKQIKLLHKSDVLNKYMIFSRSSRPSSYFNG